MPSSSHLHAQGASSATGAVADKHEFLGQLLAFREVSGRGISDALNEHRGIMRSSLIRLRCVDGMTRRCRIILRSFARCRLCSVFGHNLLREITDLRSREVSEQMKRYRLPITFAHTITEKRQSIILNRGHWLHPLRTYSSVIRIPHT